MEPGVTLVMQIVSSEKGTLTAPCFPTGRRRAEAETPSPCDSGGSRGGGKPAGLSLSTPGGLCSSLAVSTFETDV